MGFVATAGSTSRPLADFRDEMSVTERWAYFDHAAVGPIPRRAAEAIRRWADQACADGDVHWPEWSRAASTLRQNAATLVHASTREIALVPNTTFGINLIALGFPWRSGDSMVVLDNEFPSNLLPWMELKRRGVEVRCVSVPPDGSIELSRIREAMDGSTRLVAISWVGYISGYRVNLSDVCDMVHRQGAQVFVDAIQGLGVFPLDTQSVPIDYAAADGHKWMLGPEGAGILYVREKHLPNLVPAMVGWNSIEASHTFEARGAQFKTDASRYEGGTPNHVGQLGFAQSLGLLLELGCHTAGNAVEQAVLDNAASIRDVIRSLGGSFPFRVPSDKRSEHDSGIIAFEIPGRDPVVLRKHLLKMGVVLSVRHGLLRIATHGYNDASDIERLKTALQQSMKESDS